MSESICKGQISTQDEASRTVVARYQNTAMPSRLPTLIGKPGAGGSRESDGDRGFLAVCGPTLVVRDAEIRRFYVEAPPTRQVPVVPLLQR